MNIEYTWTLLFLPLAIAAANWLFLQKHGNLAALTSTIACAATLLIAIGLIDVEGEASFAWLNVSESFTFNIGFLLDPLSTRMMIVVTGIGFLVHLFSLGYMKDDEAKARYFTGLSIFMFSMTGIVLSNNLAMTFIFWELVGFSSYLLIGHWYKKNTAAEAAKKAFITNRVGDFGFLIGILVTWGLLNTLNFSAMNLSGGIPESLMSFMIICLFCGAVGKSAQFPLHVWLPDAMEGPTPVSALIHAATMVAAGVYLMVRIQCSVGLEAFTPLACNLITAIGAATAVLAAFMATQQNDIKRILAYSTLSQLGYMVMAVGLLAGEAAMFHLYTHAWFKALLFLGSGAVIFACHHKQDIWEMGGLVKKMPWTSICFMIGTAALIAVPGTSGFFSKESILVAAMAKSDFFFWVGVSVAFLTTFYMMRLIFVAFLGKTRSKEAEHAHDVEPTMRIPLIILAVMSIIAGFGFCANELVPFSGFIVEGFHTNMAFWASLCALVLGILVATAIYARGPKQDPLAGNCISRLFENRFYIDEFYNAVLIKGIQGSFAAVVDFIDQFIIGGIIVQGSARLVAGIGAICRRFQAGYLGFYALLIGLGIVGLIYLMLFYVR